MGESDVTKSKSSVTVPHIRVGPPPVLAVPSIALALEIPPRH